jgi:hypothetical protein
MSHAVDGLPPAAVSPRLMFVYPLHGHDVDFSTTGGGAHQPRLHTELGAWSGKRDDGVILSFFKSVRDAKFSQVPVKWLYGGERLRNVVVTWDQDSKPRSFRRLVLGCLRSQGQRSGPTHPTPRATLATFAGRWGGHDRGLTITANGNGNEFANASCCVRVYQMTYRIFAYHGTVTNGTALYRVTSFRKFLANAKGMTIRVGQIGKLRLRNGILTNVLTDDYFCSGPAWDVTGACGA